MTTFVMQPPQAWRSQFGSLAALALFPVLTFAQSNDLPNPTRIKAAAAKGVNLLQQVGARWRIGCTSCHNQILPLMAFSRARAHGVPVNEDQAREMLKQSLKRFRVDYAIQGWNPEATEEEAYTLIAAHESGVEPNPTTAAYARQFARTQMPDGHWLICDNRPPQSSSEITSTAFVIRAIRLYSPDAMSTEVDARVKRAGLWLENQEAKTTEEQTFQVLGMFWAGADQAALEGAAARLLRGQRADGGWSRVSDKASEAFSTGEALVALNEIGVLASEAPAYRRGIQFLLSSQHPDGSWLVETDLHPPADISPPYFESGFPYGHSQFLSCAGTSWAVMALSLALPAAPDSRRFKAAGGEIMPDKLEPWAGTIMFGTIRDVQDLLKHGFDPNSATAEGSTALMLAVPDVEKFRTLVEAGADVNGRAKSGVTPLIVASGYRGTLEIVRYLLEHGAQVDPVNPLPQFHMSPAYMAALVGEAGTLQLLLEKGADFRHNVTGFWLFEETLWHRPVVQGDPAIVRCFASRFNAQELGEALKISAFSNRTAAAAVLLSAGADVNYVDKEGMTALLYAASVDFGTTDMVQTLLKHGADIRARTKEGLTAVEVAKKYGHHQIEAALQGERAKLN